MTASRIVPVTAVHQAHTRTRARKKVGFKTRRDFLLPPPPSMNWGCMDFFVCAVYQSGGRQTDSPLIPFRPHHPHGTVFTEEMTVLFAPDVDYDHPSIDHHEDGGV